MADSPELLNASARRKNRDADPVAADEPRPMTEAGRQMVNRVNAHNAAHHPEWDEDWATRSLVARIEEQAAHPDLLKIGNQQWDRGYVAGKVEARSLSDSKPLPDEEDAVWAHVIREAELHEPALLPDDALEAVNEAIAIHGGRYFLDRSWIRPGPLLEPQPALPSEPPDPDQVNATWKAGWDAGYAEAARDRLAEPEPERERAGDPLDVELLAEALIEILGEDDVLADGSLWKPGEIALNVVPAYTRLSSQSPVASEESPT